MLPVKKILCPTDFSDSALAALNVACELAQHFDAELRVLHVVPYSPPFPSDMIVIGAANVYPSDRERCDMALQKVKELIVQHVPPDVVALAEVKMGYASNEIVVAADEEDVEMIVMGTHGASGWRHLAFGSVTEKVVRTAHRHVLSVHCGPRPNRTEVSEALEQNPSS